MASIFSFRNKVQSPDPQVVEGGGVSPPDSVMPTIVEPPLDISQIAAQAEAVHNGTVARATGDREVLEHHREKYSAVLSKAAEGPSGSKATMTEQLKAAKSDIAAVEQSLSQTTKGDEVDQTIESKRTIVERVDLGVTTGGAFLLAGWSVATMHAFLENSAILHGSSAWAGAVGPIVAAMVLKSPLNVLTVDRQKMQVQLAYITAVGLAATTWVLTFGHEAGGVSQAAMSDLGNVTSGAGESNTARMMIRGVAQLFMEMFGGAILVHRCFEIWNKNAPGQIVKVYKIRDKWAQESAELRALRDLEKFLEHQIAQIDQWFATHPHLIDAYLSKAKGQFLNNINLLQGGAT